MSTPEALNGNEPDGKTLDKIRKMLALAASSNQGESETAMGKVMEFLTRHNLTLQEVEAHSLTKREYITHTFDEGTSASDEREHIGPIIKKFFNVNLVAQGGRLHFLGTKVNVEIAVYIYNYLCQMFDLLWQIHEIQTPKLTKGLERWEILSVKGSYQKGLANGLANTLESQKRTTQEQMGLVLIKDPDLDAYMWEKFPKTAPPSEEERKKWEEVWKAKQEKETLERQIAAVERENCLKRMTPHERRAFLDREKYEEKERKKQERAEAAGNRLANREADKANNKRWKAQGAAYDAGQTKGREIRINPGLNEGAGDKPQLN